MNRSYFDHNATTPISPEILKIFMEASARTFGNASSIHHDGQEAKHRLEEAREQVAARLGCDSKEIVFVSGGTEANNMAIFGSVEGREGAHVVTTAIEHPAVLQPCARLEQAQARVSRVPVGSTGIVNPDDVRRALRPDTSLISVMHVNNEIGTIQPIAEIARIAAEAGVPFHSDGVQAAGRIPVHVHNLGVDFYSVSGHKMYAPKGVGILYIRKGAFLRPLLSGGSHEMKRRAGTENVPAAIAIGAACVRRTDSARIAALRDRLERGILDRVPDASVNGSTTSRVPNTTNVAFDGIDGEAVVIGLDLKGFAVSSGSACSSGAVEPSHVLTAIGLSRDQARSSVRFSLGESNGEADVDELIRAVESVVARLRSLSPAYAMGEVRR